MAVCGLLSLWLAARLESFLQHRESFQKLLRDFDKLPLGQGTMLATYSWNRLVLLLVIWLFVSL